MKNETYSFGVHCPPPTKAESPQSYLRDILHGENTSTFAHC